MPRLLVGAAAALALCACRREQPAAPGRPVPGHTVRALAREAARAEVWENGLFVLAGTADQHKYMRPGTGMGWGESREGPAPFVRALNGSVLRFTAGPAERVRWVVIHARSSLPGQTVSVEAGGVSTASRPLGSDFATVELPFPAALQPGPHRVRFFFGQGTAGGPVADVRWIWLATERADRSRAPGPQKTAVRAFGEPRLALLADRARTYRYYLPVPPRAALTFAYAAERAARMHVDVASDSTGQRRVFSASVGPGRWRSGRVDLGAFAGRMVRLDLVVEGDRPAAAWGEPELVLPGPAPVAPPLLGAARPRRVVLVVVDAARQDMYRPFSPSSPVDTPGLARLAREGTIFTEAYAPSNWTLPSVASLLSGRQVGQELHDGKRGLAAEVPLVTEELRRRGVTTAAFVANLFVTEAFGLGRGWDVYRNFHLPSEKIPEEAAHAGLVFPEVLRWLTANRERRSFVYVHTFDPHAPYYRRSPYTERFLGSPYRGKLGRDFTEENLERYAKSPAELDARDRGYVRALYQGEVAFHEAHFDRFLDGLKRAGLLDQTLLVYTSDHGEELFDHGSLDHGQTMYEEVARVPLALRYPAFVPAGRVVREIVDLVDLAPTILEALGVPLPAGLHGLSLLGAVHGAPRMVPAYALSQGLLQSVRVGAYKLIVDDTKGREELYDLVADPRERANLAAASLIARRGCEALLDEGASQPAKSRRLSGAASERPRTVPAKLEDAVRQRIQGLGYLND